MLRIEYYESAASCASTDTQYGYKLNIAFGTIHYMAAFAFYGRVKTSILYHIEGQSATQHLIQTWKPCHDTINYISQVAQPLTIGWQGRRVSCSSAKLIEQTKGSKRFCRRASPSFLVRSKMDQWLTIFDAKPNDSSLVKERCHHLITPCSPAYLSKNIIYHGSNQKQLS